MVIGCCICLCEESGTASIYGGQSGTRSRFYGEVIVTVKAFVISDCFSRCSSGIAMTVRGDSWF